MTTISPSPSPSPPISSSPGSLSSASSNSASSSLRVAPNPASPPAPAPFKPFDLPSHKQPFPTSSSSSTASPPSLSSEEKRRNRLSQPVGAGVAGVMEVEGASTAAGRGNGSVRQRPKLRSRTLSLSFSSKEQAFFPTAMRPSASTSTATSTFTFPSVEEGKVTPSSSSATSVALDRTPSAASTASVTRRPRPARASTSRLDMTRSGHTLRVPTASTSQVRLGKSTGEAQGDPAADYLEAKVVILGSQGVGKTSLITRSTTGRFSYQLSSTIGASFLTKKLNVSGTKVRFQIWDPAGQERFRSMAPLYYRGALAAILVYDITDENSFQDIKIWLEELRKNMSSELIILVVGAKADLATSYRTIPLSIAERSVALWLHELDNPPDDPPTPKKAVSTSSASHVPFPTFDPLSIRLAPPSPREYPPSSPTRSRTHTSPPTTPPVPPPHPTISAPPPTTPSAALERVRKMSNKLAYGNGGAGPPFDSGNGLRPHRQHNHPGLTSSMTMPDLSAYAVPSGPSPWPSLYTLPPPHLSASEMGMVRSTSNKIGLSLSSLGMSAANRRLSHDERARRALEEQERERERERREREEEEERRINKIVDECEIRIVEVSAKDGFGIEEVFLTIAEQLITRKAEIEAARILRSRDSIMLRNDDAIDTSQPGWCAC
ncbi:hypothetical protein JCM1840_000941 [Sporobolomyces johnsonii]